MNIDTIIKLLIGAVCAFFVALAFLPNIINEHGEIDRIRELSSADELIDVGITSTNTHRTDRGAIIIGDSIYLWKLYKPCFESIDKGYRALGEVDTPYRIKKEKGTSRFTVIKGGVTIDFCPKFGKKAENDPWN